MQTTYTASAGDKVSFFWKVSSESSDWLEFYIDGSRQDRISGDGGDWEKQSFSLSAGSRTLKWRYVKDGSDYDGDDCGWVDGIYVGPSSGSLPADPEGPGDYAEAVESSLKFTSSGDSTWAIDWDDSAEHLVDADSAKSWDVSGSEESILQTIVDSDSSETLKFWWKVESELYEDYLEFYIDGTLQSGRISGDTEWAQKTYTISSGIHTLKWRYVTDSSGEYGENCGWIDFVEWSGASPVPDSDNWEQIDYKYDVVGRRSEKIIDGYGTRYVYDGGNVIAEYDGNNNLLRKFVYGPGVDKPVSMTEEADSETYYYHYDALGSVIALSDSAGDTVQTYEYSVFGEVSVEDASHTNPYMFAGRRYDIEIGLYYNRARYYNPYTGRFLQTDPIGYGDGINWYAYCRNNPVGRVDPSGTLGVFVIPPLTEEQENERRRENSFHFDRNKHNMAHVSVAEANDCFFFTKESIVTVAYHWPDTYRGWGPYAGFQASYYPEDYKEDPNLAGMLDDQTPKMGTYDYYPPGENALGHFLVDMLLHSTVGNDYTPNLTTWLIDCPFHNLTDEEIATLREIWDPDYNADDADPYDLPDNIP